MGRIQESIDNPLLVPTRIDMSPQDRERHLSMRDWGTDKLYNYIWDTILREKNASSILQKIESQKEGLHITEKEFLASKIFNKSK